MNDFWNEIYFGNSIKAWIIVIGIIIFCFAAIRLFTRLVLIRVKQWSEKTKTSLDDFILASIEKSVIPFVYFLTIYASASYLTLAAGVTTAIHTGMLLITTFFVLKLISSALQYAVFAILKKQDDGDLKQRQAKGLMVIIKVAIWILGIVFLLDNLGYNVTTIVAGLGIGGIAIALAAQAILGDLFSYFVILFDRPFEIGDFIIVDDKMGVVEYIGIKTTRLRTLSGEQLVCSNKDLTDSRVHNYKRMEKRRVVFTLGVTYQTPPKTMELIPQLVKNIILKKNSVVFDRGHFAGFKDWSLTFEFVYFVLTSDYNVYMDIQQSIYLDILKSFEERGIEFAYPTQTVFMNKQVESIL